MGSPASSRGTRRKSVMRGPALQHPTQACGDVWVCLAFDSFLTPERREEMLKSASRDLTMVGTGCWVLGVGCWVLGVG